MSSSYRGRLAPSPTGYLHLGHARTFWTAQERARAERGVLVLRNEDLDRARCKAAFAEAFLEDLRWLGLEWQEGPDCGGPFAPYQQSQRLPLYRAALDRLRAGGFVYPCTCSRQDVLRALQAPHAGEDEPIYPGTCRTEHPGAPASGTAKLPSHELGRPTLPQSPLTPTTGNSGSAGASPHRIRSGLHNWRFRVPDGETISFRDGYHGPQQFVAGRDFGDFIVWRHDDVPAYHLAVVVDDAAMQITEVVRGADLLRSTARQLLLYRALGFQGPAFYHCPLVTDEHGERLAKRHDALSLRTLRERGFSPEAIRGHWSDALHPADFA